MKSNWMKLLVLVIAAAMSLSLFACGGVEENESDTKAPSQSTEKKTDKTTEEKTDAKTETDTEQTTDTKGESTTAECDDATESSTVSDSTTDTEAPTDSETSANTETSTLSECEKNGHTEVIDQAVEATCTQTGLTEGKHCSVCNTVIVAQKETPKSENHTYQNGVCIACKELQTKGLEYTLVGDSYYEVSGIGTCTDKELYILPEYQGLPIKSIGNSAFYGCSNLTCNIYGNAKYL